MKYLDENGLLYYTQKIKTWLAGKANASHTHVKADITDYTDYTLPTASSSRLGGVKVGAGLSISNGVLSATGGGTADSVDWENVQNRPTKVSDFTNDSGFQTASQVNTAIQNVIGSAPAALDTLKELADALGDDPNFAATMATALAGKVSTSDLAAITNAEIDTICS